ncbi:MarR family winged helix-turn-helix transcriptional regulator [Chloroflexota bacterium]
MSTPTIPREERIKTINDTFHLLFFIVGRQFSQWLQSFGLTPPQFMALTHLVFTNKDHTMRELTQLSFQDAPTMTGIVDRLVKMGLVQRTRSDTDRRVVLVQATPAGTELVKRVKKEIRQESTGLFTALTDDDLISFEYLLEYLLRVYVGRYTLLQDADLDAEIEKLHCLRNLQEAGG